MTKVVAGIDIGGTYTKFGIVDKAGKVYADDSISTDNHTDINMYLEELGGSIEKHMSQPGMSFGCSKWQLLQRGH